VSTNFYWIGVVGNEDGIGVHIGKRNAAGVYCFDCGVAQTKSTQELHTGKGDKHKRCPGCGMSFDTPLDTTKSTALLEAGVTPLGYVKNQSGIGTCSTFTWTALAHKWKIRDAVLRGGSGGDKVIRDGLGVEYSYSEFWYDVLGVYVVQEFQASYEFS